MLLLGLGWKQRVASEELSRYTAKTPDIDATSIGDPKHYLWSSVESTLDVGVDLFMPKAAGPEVNQPDA